MLKKQLQSDMIKYMKGKQKDTVATIRMVNGAIKNKEIEVNKGMEVKRELADDEVVAIIVKEIKQYNDTLEFEVQRGNEIAIAEINASIKVLSNYLPKPLTEDEAKALVKEILTENGFTEKKQMGLAMKVVVPKLKGRFDGSKVNKLVMEFLV